ncbi:MAG: hypothetical protein GWP19_06460 [Planctomycetia bacterium]|nr:hypothetical protein [Planctomycetia bacterium]
MSYYPISIQNVKKNVARKKRLYSRNDIALFSEKKDTYNNVKTISNEFGETLTRVDGNIPPDLEIKNGQRFLFISYDQSKYSHGIHKYPAKFFPELPRWLIQRYSKENDIILDPFTGSGTTNVEALLAKRNSIGIDVDPFSRFLSKVKTTPLDQYELDKYNEVLLENIIAFNPSSLHLSDIPSFPYRDNWFNEEILYELAFIRRLINTLDSNKEIKDFYQICLSSIIRFVSNADNNCTRTVIRKKLNKSIYPSMALTKFAEMILINSFRITDFTNNIKSNCFVELPEEQDARNISYSNGYIDFAVTSPPYVNAVDYPRTHQLEIYWLGIMNGSLTPLKKMHVGTESVSISDYKHLHKIGIPEIDKKLKSIYNIDQRRSFIAYKYLLDMNANLSEVHKVLKKGSKYVVVVGNNTIRGIKFENWKYLMSLAELTGFKIRKYFGSEIIKHFIKVPREERINTDWVIVLEK